MKKNFLVNSFGFALVAFLSITTFCGVASIKSINADVKEDGITLKSLIQSVHDNNLQTVTSNQLFNVSLKHGWLNASQTPGCKDYTTKDVASNYVGPDSSGEAYIDWGGNRLNRGADCTILKFEAKKDITITGYATNMTDTGDWNNKNIIEIFKVHPVTGWDYYENDWIGDGNRVHTIYPDAATKLEDFSYSINLQAGDKLYWEYGKWEDSQGNLDIDKRGFGFKFTQVQSLYISDMITRVCSSLDEPIHTDLVDYGIGHGNIKNTLAEEPVVPFTSGRTSPDILLGVEGSNCYANNWRIIVGHNDGFVAAFMANNYIRVHISRPNSGSGWTNGCEISVAINGEVISEKVVSESQGDPNGTYYDFDGVLKSGDMLMWQLNFEWDDSRNLAMRNSQGDIKQDMPIFTFELIPHNHNFSAKYDGTKPTCVSSGLKDYYGCECGLFAEDSEGKVIIGNTLDLDDWASVGGKGYLEPINHSYGEITYIWNDDFTICTAARVCSVCLNEEIIEVSEASYVKDVDATCETNEFGHMVAKFVDSSLQTQVTEPLSCELPGTSLGHLIEKDKIKYTWSDDYKECTAASTCKRSGCNFIVAEKGVVTYVVDTPATCESDEKGHVEATFINDIFEKQVTAPNSITKQGTALGHDYKNQTPTYTWSEDNKTCVAEVTCSRNGCTHKESETANVIEKDGNYVAEFKNNLFETQTKEMPKKSGCGGSVIACCALLSILCLGGVTFLLYRKRKENF